MGTAVRVETGLSKAFSDFAAQAEPRLRQALVSVLGVDTARDATAEALLFAWEHWEKIEAMDNPVGYLYRVGRSRGRRLQGRSAFRYPEVPESREPWIEPGLPEALRRLTPRQRTIVLLIHSYQWTYSETAEVLDVSVNTVHKHRERAMRKLRAALEVSDA